LCPEKLNGLKSFKELIKFVTDRPGHDKRYAIDSMKIKQNLNWEPKETFETGLRKTILWYLDNLKWSEHIKDNIYHRKGLGS